MVKLKMSGNRSKPQGQAMVEYALILVLLALAAGVTLAATGPAIGNVFCNVVRNIGGDEALPQGGNCGSTAPNLVNEGGDPPLFWKTVTWVAGHPQTETPFPTPIHRAPTSVGAGQRATDTPTPTDTFTPTPTNTLTPTDTLTPSPGPSPTVSDSGWTLPFVDQMNDPSRWRLDLADVWKVQWYNYQTHGSRGTSGWPITFSQSENITTFVSSNSFSFDWGNNASPGGNTGVTATTGYGASFTRTFFIAQTTSYTISIAADDAANVYLDGQNPPIVWSQAWNVGGSATVSIPAGMHTIRVDYAEDGGGANISFSMTPGATSGTALTAHESNSCLWGQNESTTTSGLAGSNSVSPLFQFEDNPGQTSWPGNQTCTLELRGYVDVGTNAHPILSFWDIWDFANASNVTAELDVGSYAVDGSGNPVPTNWTAIATRSQGTSNYAWTRSQIDLSSFVAAQSGNTKVTFRFIIGSNAAQSGPFRWYIDDLQVVNDAAPSTTYTINNSWNMNDRLKMDNFIYDGDSFDNQGLTSPSTTRRWDLTTTHAHSGMAWDDSPTSSSNTTGSYQNLYNISAPTGAANARVHYLEFKYPIDITTADAPTQDSSGNTGHPMLSFWEAYDIALNASIRVQYTRDSTDPSENLSSSSIESWTDVPNGVIVDYNSVPSGASRTNLTMQQVQLDLTAIPNWQTQPFRLRFALYVDNGAAAFGQGWYIDDIAFVRQNGSPYIAYPFVDNAENPTFTASTWDAIGSKWGATTEKGGALNTATAYADSPYGNYTPNDVQMLQMHYAIDLLHDTSANTTDSPGRAAAINPTLTFWMLRKMNTNAKLTVDLWTAYNNTWSTVWTYDASVNGYNT
ncbi:MAG TPA: hypothetical protein VHD90_26370, partial [Phototrophicaceae bacterium]|nr:hypothetical protein [Phototrophicaceae bacterium]